MKTKNSLNNEKYEQAISAKEAASLLGVSIKNIVTLEKQGVLHKIGQREGKSFYDVGSINRIHKNKGISLSDEAAQVGVQLQREIFSSVSTVRYMLFVAGGGFIGYCSLVIIFVIFFAFFPLQTARWLGYTTDTSNKLRSENGESQVLGAATDVLSENATGVQTLLQPISRVALGIVKYSNPKAYKQVSQVTIIDPNDIFAPDGTGAVTPIRSIKLANSSQLQVGSSSVIENLNSQFLQGKKPGNNVGDIAIVGAQSETTVAAQSSGVAVLSPALPPSISSDINNLTDENLSGSAGISNANLANAAVTIATANPLSGGGLVSLGGTVTLSCPTCATSGESLFTSSSTDTLTNKTIVATANTISGLNATNLTVGDYSSVITSGTYAINITGSVTSATGFSGLLSGDVSGGQGSTTVAKINGNTLGLTTTTAGNLLVGDGSSWVTQTLSGDATITSSGVLTLKNTGSAATYGSASAIPVFTTDAKGRVTSVTNTTIAGLTTTHLSAVAGITNDQLANSGVTINTTGPLSGGGVVSLGGNLTLTCPTCLSSGGSLFTAAATSGSNSSLSQGGTLTLIAGSNMTTTGNGTGGITFATSATPTFTTVNGLTITNNGTNTLTIAAGKTLTANNSITFSGTDGTTFTLPSSSDTLVGRVSTDTLTNKTIAAGSNTISGLTNANLSGAAGITNANLANSSVTVSAGTGLSGGGLVALGDAIILSNSGVLSLTGTSNQVNVSAASGSITVSLPQNVHTGASPTFSVLNLSSNTNQLLFGTTNVGTLTWSPSASRTVTLPDATDTLVGKATVDTLTNKTLTAPAINGTVTTTGLTLPAFTASGNITGSGSPTISNFGTINGLTLTAASDGLTVAGGTTSRTLTVTGSDITVGSTIKPTASGGLTVQSNGANALIIDAGGASTVSLATTSASAVIIGRAGITTTINGTVDANNLKIGGGETITKHLSGTNTFDAAGIALGACGDLGTVTVTGAAVGDTVTATPTAVSGGIETLLLIWNAYVSSTNTVTIRACSVATLGTQNPPSQSWRADVWQH